VTRRKVLSAVLLAPLLAGVAACGKKGRPKRPDGSSGIKIDPEKLKKKGQS
jgi:predicted small lipoprotein YifL